MTREIQELPPIISARLIVYMMAIGAVLALILYLLQLVAAPFYQYLIFSQAVAVCQGLCIIGCFRLFSRYRHSSTSFSIQCFAGFFIGSLIGLQLGYYFCGGRSFLVVKGAGFFKGGIPVGIALGALIISVFFIVARFRREGMAEMIQNLLTFPYLFASFAFNFSVACILYAVGVEGSESHFFGEMLFNPLCIGLVAYNVDSGQGDYFGELFFISQSIGLLCNFFVWCCYYLFGRFHPFIAGIVGVLLGSFIGPLFGALVFGKTELIFNLEISAYSRVILIGLLCAIVGTTYFYIRAQLAATQAKAERERFHKIEAEKAFVETNLRLLQAQIEPHFLFNTLSNAISLLDTDVSRGQSMLVDLSRYLRTSLARTRSEETTLGQELDLVQAYLNIFKIRLGERLQFAFDVPEELREVPFPSLLVQPLVENSLIHGISPKVEGGEIRVSVRPDGDTLQLTIFDSGLGMTETSSTVPLGHGVGLQNIRERLKSLYGQAARLTLTENVPGGITAVLEVPYAK